jgi:hypothetical protein
VFVCVCVSALLKCFFLFSFWSCTADADALSTPQKPAWIGLDCDGVDVDVDVNGARTKKEWFRYEGDELGLGAGKCRCDG